MLLEMKAQISAHLMFMCLVTACVEKEPFWSEMDDGVGIVDGDTDADTGSDTDVDTDVDSDTDICPAMESSVNAQQLTRANHTDYSNPNCLTSGCHTCTKAGVTIAADCATCHGGNGGQEIICASGSTSNCADCHENTHTYQVAEPKNNAQCNVCHER